MEEIKKKINIRILLLCIILLSIFGISYGIFKIFVKLKLDTRITYVASHTIAPRTIIKEEDLLEIEVANAYIFNNTFINKEDIIGKITDIQGSIPAGSPFYKTALFEIDKIKDKSITMLKENQTAYTMSTEMYKVSSFNVSNRVDVYLNINNKDNPITGRLFKDVRILAIKDNRGLLIDDIESNGIPYYIELAIDQKDISLITLAESLGDIRLYLSNNQSNPSLEASLDEESEIIKYIETINKKDNEEEIINKDQEIKVEKKESGENT